MIRNELLYNLVIDTLKSYPSNITQPFLNKLPPAQVLETKTPETTASPPVTILNRLGPAVPETQALVDEIVSSAPTSNWRQPYTPEEAGNDFVHGSAWLPIADSNGPLVLNNGLVEVMIFDANINYPLHSHSAEELYLVLAGEFWWEAPDDDRSPAWLRAGQLVHHPPYQAHALTTGDEPSLLLAIWRGSGFQKPSFIS